MPSSTQCVAESGLVAYAAMLRRCVTQRNTTDSEPPSCCALLCLCVVCWLSCCPCGVWFVLWCHKHYMCWGVGGCCGGLHAHTQISKPADCTPAGSTWHVRAGRADQATTDLLLSPCCHLLLCAMFACTSCRARAAGRPGELAVYRLVVRNSVEDRLLQLADR